MLLDLARNGTWVAALPNLSVPGANFLVLLSTLIRSRFQVKPATLLIPIDFSFPFRGGGALRTRYQSGSFSLINVGSGFRCLRISSFSFFYVCLVVGPLSTLR